MQAQQDDTREEVRLSKEAEMLGLGVIMLDDLTGVQADTWYDWIQHTATRSELDVTVTAMSLTLAMSKNSWSEEYDGMPDILDLLEHLLLKQVEMDGDFDNIRVFESSLVGALLGSCVKVVKINI